jgi:hypothetical protein
LSATPRYAQTTATQNVEASAVGFAGTGFDIHPVRGEVDPMKHERQARPQLKQLSAYHCEHGAAAVERSVPQRATCSLLSSSVERFTRRAGQPWSTRLRRPRRAGGWRMRSRRRTSTHQSSSSRRLSPSRWPCPSAPGRSRTSRPPGVATRAPLPNASFDAAPLQAAWTDCTVTVQGIGI